MSDIQLVEVPLSELKTSQGTTELVSGPGATVTIRVRTASCKVTITDRTQWPLKGVTVEVWSQILGYTNADGLYDSPLFFAGDYPLKVRAPFVGGAGGGPNDAVRPFEVSQDSQFLDGPTAISLQVGLSASGLSAYERAFQIFSRSIPKAPGAFRDQIRGMKSAESIEIMVALASLWVASHFVGVGEAADLLLGIAAVIKFGLTIQLARAIAVDLMLLLTAILVGKNEFELDEAAAALARIVVNLATIAFTKVAEEAIKTGVRNSYRPKGIPNEITKEPPRSPNVNEAMQSKLGKGLAGVMGDATFEERLKGAEACAKADPTLTKIPAEDAASLRGYTSHKVSELGRASGEADYTVLNRALRAGNAPFVGKAVEYLDSILRAYDRFPKYRGKSFRGVNLDRMPGFADKLKAGHVFRDKGFFSSSIEEQAAMDYLLGKATNKPGPPPKKGLFIHARGYTSRYIQSLTEEVGDKEALFRPGSIFLVVGRWVEVVKTEVDGVMYDTEVTHVAFVEVEQSIYEFASTWGKSGALVANILALRRWDEKHAQKAGPAASGAH